eukprot:TRINITY_DN9506_c0_g1_i1.p1 TRINITY_DN9506_c0_g1~~TRINITY_DN9506_c0_g1_i1.p1  ORF type:complete len:848 (-),score=196.83 TRINITY_DN9506_c0_g1_i1:64-2244(-)
MASSPSVEAPEREPPVSSAVASSPPVEVPERQPPSSTAMASSPSVEAPEREPPVSSAVASSPPVEVPERQPPSSTAMASSPSVEAPEREPPVSSAVASWLSAAADPASATDADAADESKLSATKSSQSLALLSSLKAKSTASPKNAAEEKTESAISDAAGAVAFRLRYTTEVRQAPSQQSPLFHVAQAGTVVKQMGALIRLANGELRCPIQPRGWIDMAALEPLHSMGSPPGLALPESSLESPELTPELKSNGDGRAAVPSMPSKPSDAREAAGSSETTSGYSSASAKAKSVAKITRSALAALNKSIEDHLNSANAALAHADAAARVLGKVKDAMRKMSLHGDVVVFGSCATGFKSGSSDIDVTYAGDVEVGSINSMLANFARMLPDLGFETVTKVLSANTPLVRFTDHQSGIEVDFCMQNALGIRNSLLLDCYCRFDQRIAQLGRLVKDWAKRHELVGTADGFLNSYAYMLLVIYYLQTRNPPVAPNLQKLAEKSVPVWEAKHGVDDKWETKFVEDVHKLPPSESKKSIGELFTGFFKFYSQSFDWSQNAVCSRLSGPNQGVDKFSLSTTTFPEQWYVEDPFDLKHNLAGRCSPGGRERILKEMRNALSVLQSSGSVFEVCGPTKQESFFLRCRVGPGLTPEALLEEFRSCDLARLHFPKPQGGRFGQAFLEFCSSAARRHGHAKNEGYVGDCQLSLMQSTRFGLMEASEEFEYAVYEASLAQMQ